MENAKSVRMKPEHKFEKDKTWDNLQQCSRCGVRRIVPAPFAYFTEGFYPLSKEPSCNEYIMRKALK